MPSLLGGFCFIYGKLAPGEPRAVSLDSPGAGSYRRTATSEISLNYTNRQNPRPLEGQHPSAISLNYGTPRGSSERTTFGRATPAVEWPLLAEERGDARYAASTPTSANSLNYRKPMERTGPTTFCGAAPAIGRPFLARKQEEARHAASAPTSENSLNYKVEEGPTTFGGQGPSAPRQGSHRQMASARTSANSLTYEKNGQRLTSGISLNYGHETGRAALREREPTASGWSPFAGKKGPMTFGRPTLAGEQGETRKGPSSSCYMASASPSENSLNYGNEKQLDVLRKAEPMAFGRCPALSGEREPGCHMASKIARERGPATFGQFPRAGKGERCQMASDGKFVTLGKKAKREETEKSSLGLPQREKVRPTIWQKIAPFAPTTGVEGTETAQGPNVMGVEVRGVGSMKRDGSLGRTSELGEKRVCFEPSPHIIPDAWFTVLSEGARFPSREAEERLRDKLLGRTIREVAFGDGKREANDETEPEASGAIGRESESDGEQEGERAVEDTPTGEVRPARRRQWVTRVKKRWRVLAGQKARAVKVKTRRPVLRLTQTRPRALKEASEPVTESQGAAAPPTVRRYVSLMIGGKAYPALLDSGATCWLAGPPLVERFADRLKPNNSRV